MGFQDVLKKSFLLQVGGAEPDITSILLTIVVTGLLGVYVYAVYRLVSKRAFYSKNFNISLVALAMITAAIILAIQSSVVISLGMVGALSIVRFRTAIKDPIDLVFLFWSISLGIICGAGLFGTAVIVSICVTVVMLLLELFPTARVPMLLLLNMESDTEEKEICDVVSEYAKYYHIKSRNLTPNGMDMVIELRMKDGETDMLKKIKAIRGVVSVSLLDHDGEATF